MKDIKMKFGSIIKSHWRHSYENLGVLRIIADQK